jgi:signal transduction histidine kinase
MRDALGHMIVHDLRNPLSALRAGLLLARDRLPAENQHPLVKQGMSVALRSSDKLMGLVNMLLDIAKMESGDITLTLATVSLHRLANDLITDLTLLANENGLILVNDVPAELAPLRIDAEKIARVLTNLIDNAIKFTPPSGQVRVTAEALPTDLAGKVWVRCAIIDTGPGIPDEYRDKVFERFFQVSGIVGSRSGSGLGLSFCKLAIEAHGGKIWVENLPEGGSAFYFTLPT